MPSVTLNGSQRLMLYWERSAPVNACHAIELGSKFTISGDQFQKIVPEFLRAVGMGEVTADAGTLHAEFTPFRDCDITSERTCGNFDRSLESIIDRELARPFATTSCPVRFVWVEESCPQSVNTPLRRTILLIYRHAVADGVAISAVMQQLVAYCCGSPEIVPLAIYQGSLSHDIRQDRRSPSLSRSFCDVGRDVLALTRCLWPRLTVHRTLCPPITQLHPDRIPVSQIRLTAQSCGVTVQDLLFAGALESLAREAAFCAPGFLRSRISLQSPVNLRNLLGPMSGTLFGQLLGAYQVRQSISRRSTFLQILDDVHRQTSAQKRRFEATTFPRSCGFMAMLGRNMPGQSGFIMGRYFLPIIGTISNIYFRDQFQSEFENGTVVGYQRAAHIGHVMPLVLLVTSVGDHVSFASTRRESFLNGESLRRVVSHMVRRASGDVESQLVE